MYFAVSGSDRASSVARRSRPCAPGPGRGLDRRVRAATSRSVGSSPGRRVGPAPVEDVLDRETEVGVRS